MQVEISTNKGNSVITENLNLTQSFKDAANNLVLSPTVFSSVFLMTLPDSVDKINIANSNFVSLLENQNAYLNASTYQEKDAVIASLALAVHAVCKDIDTKQFANCFRNNLCNYYLY